MLNQINFLLYSLQYRSDTSVGESHRHDLCQDKQCNSGCITGEPMAICVDLSN